MRTPIHIQREIVRLHFYDPRQSNSRIAELVGVAPNTVRALRLKVTGAARTLDDLIHLPDGAWCTVLHTIDRSIAKRKSAPDWDWVHEQMQMRELRLTSMARALEMQLQSPVINDLAFEDRVGLLIEHEWSERENRKLKRLVRGAGLPEMACLEDIDYRATRNLGRTRKVRGCCGSP